MKLEVAVLPVADVDRAKNFYKALGWREDAVFAAGTDFRVVQLTPPGSACSVIFGTGVTSAAPGSADGLQLVVDDIEAARAELASRGVEVSEVFHDAGGCSTTPGPPHGSLVRPRATGATARGCRSATRTATAGSSRRSRRACRAA
nr:VOC family protein [Protofrankia coriariae]